MTTATLAGTAYSIQSAKPTRQYGQLANIPIRYSIGAALFRFPLSRIPDDATILSATISVYQSTGSNISRTLRLAPVTSSWSSKVTWKNRPSRGDQISLTKSAAESGVSTRWDWDVTTLAQQVVDGDRADRGWEITQVDDNGFAIYGSAASRRQPFMTVEYTRVPEEPANLHPNDALTSTDHPILTFNADDNVTGIQVQIDPAMSSTAPLFDSGTVVTGGGYLDLSETAYTGVPADAPHYWRARQRNSFGWSDWSYWASMTYVPAGLLTITNPPEGDIADGTPPLMWTFDGTQEAWRARLLDAEGEEIDNSGYQPGNGTDWTPDTGLTKKNQQGTFELWVYDDFDRVATAGDPDYVRTTRVVTYVPDSSIDPMDTLVVTSADPVPDVILTGTRSEVPDQVVLFRDDERIATYDGVDVFTGNEFRIVDYNVQVNKKTTYRVAPRVNGKTGAGGPEVTITPTAKGIWITDIGDKYELDKRVVLWSEVGAGVPEQSQPETAAVHVPMANGSSPVRTIRRRLARGKPQGHIDGIVTDVPHPAARIPKASTCETWLRRWADYDAGNRYRLVFSGYSGSVILGNITFAERPDNSVKRRMLNVSFDWWEQ